MQLDFATIKDIIQTAAAVVAASAVGFAVITYLTSKKQLNFDVIVSCVERFQKILTLLEDVEGTVGRTRNRVVRQYIDLCNEELFYFTRGYVPIEIIDEWIEGMVFYLPVLYRNEIANVGCKLEEVAHSGLLNGYPRIQKAFVAKRIYDLEKDGEAAHLAHEIRQNLKRSHKL